MNWLAEQEDKYYTWLRSKTYIPMGNESDWGLISTPFTGLFNDTLEIYAKKEGDKIMLSDDGKTLHDLELMGVLLFSLVISERTSGQSLSQLWRKQ